MSLVALASCAACSIYTMIFFMLLITGFRSPLGRALAILLIPYMLWSFGNTFLLISDNVESAFFWDSIASFGWTTFPVAMLNFSLVFTKTEWKIPSFAKKLIFFGLPLLFIIAQWAGQISLPGEILWYGHSVVLENDISLGLFSVYYLPIVAASLFLIIRYIRNSVGYQRKQAIILFWFYIIPFTLSTITDSVCPDLGYKNVPPLAMIISLMLVGGILFTISRYNMLLSTNPSRALFHTLNHSHTAIKNILDSSPHFAFITDQDSIVHHINHNATNHFYNEKKLFSGRGIKELFDTKEVENFQIQLNLVGETLTPQERVYHLTKNSGDSFPATVTVAPLTDSKNYHAGFIITIVDITTHEEAEKGLLLAKKKAEEADRAKSEFLANISHELQTPMIRIIETTDMMQEIEKKPDTIEQLSMINVSSNYLLTLVNDLLDIAHIESGKFVITPETVNIRALITEVTKLFSETKNTHFSVIINKSVPENIFVDPIRLKQILINLLSNAFKFTAQGEIGLTISTKNSTLTITVSDTGIGISEKEQKTIFEKFSQGRQRQDIAIRGTGIGLAIVKELAKLMGGEVSLKSEIGKGSSFVVTVATTKEARG